MSDSSDRRIFKRTPSENLWVDIEVGPGPKPNHNEGTHRLNVRIENISDGGICIISPESFELGQKITILSENFPNQGIVAWTCQSRVECKAGIQFI